MSSVVLENGNQMFYECELTINQGVFCRPLLKAVATAKALL